MQRSSHISQCGGKHRPPPQLLHHLDPTHPAKNSFEAILENTATLIRATWKDAFPRPGQHGVEEDVTCFALLGSDYLISSEGEVKLCEVNVHPALNWGTMREVDSHIFARLVEDSLDIVFDESGSLKEEEDRGGVGKDGSGFRSIDIA